MMELAHYNNWGITTTEQPLDELLTREDVTLDDVLLHDDVLTECKFANEELLAYLATPENLASLVTHVIKTKATVTEPERPAEADGDESMEVTTSGGEGEGDDSVMSMPVVVPLGPDRRPFIASELLVCAADVMLDALVGSHALLTLLFSFLDQPAPLVPVLN
jgi:hypothetical protein